MTHEQFQGVISPKVQGSWNLHHLLPKDMDFFILLSSSAGIAGSRGQGNYAAGTHMTTTFPIHTYPFAFILNSSQEIPTKTLWRIIDEEKISPLP